MLFKRLFTDLALVSLCFITAPAAAGESIYKSTNKLDFIKLDSAKGVEKEGGLNHPTTFDPDQIRDILRSIHFNKKIFILKDVENRRLFDEQNVEFLAPYLIDAFQKAKADQVVTVSYFTRDSHLVIQNDRLTVFRAFIKEDGLHMRFTKLYAKLLGDLTTQGAARASSEARGMRVSLELQEGQNRIGWNPEELVFDLNHFRAGGALAAKDGKTSDKSEMKKDKKNKKAEKQTASSEESATAEAVDKAQSVRARLKQLDQLKKDEMITEKEYQSKRKELIKEL